MEITITSINFVYQNGLSGAITGVKLSFNTPVDNTYATSGYITVSTIEYFSNATSMEALGNIVRNRLIEDLTIEEESTDTPAE